MRLRRRLFGRQRGHAPALKTPVPTRRLDYRPPAWQVERVELHFELDPQDTLVRSRLQLRRDPAAPTTTPLVLDGRGLELLELRLDGEALAQERYRLEETRLTIADVPPQALLEVTTRIHPATNTALEGLYQSGSLLCTQCEAHGFSRITYFPDRPDVMARYRVTLSADQRRYPVLLANGNPVASGIGEGGRHWVTWEDPFPKPCYLFALVAGDLALVEDRFVTRSGRPVSLRIYVEPENRSRCAHAMASLKQAMRWDEEAYGREYDLDLFMIVAVGSFNMGAMENKGLNIFNARYIIADGQTATDDDFEAVRDIIAHEYFHNWTGNRITCRDWFQLSVKESLTVFREQQFSAAMGSPAIARIRQARLIRDQQFPEDAGPTAHPVRPDSYLEVNNLYTLTVYEKGAEVVRMLHTLLGEQTFRRAMDLYFERHDGQAVTVEDFLKAMEDASGRELAQFRLWYSQAGTPCLQARLAYDATSGTHILRLAQSCPPTPGQPHKQPLHIPVRIALLDEAGGLHHEQLVELRGAQAEWTFTGPGRPCTLSLLRGFSAPVRSEYTLDDAQLRRLSLYAGDAYACWDAAQQLFLRQLLCRVEPVLQTGTMPQAIELAGLVRELLQRADFDPALLAEMLRLPAEVQLVDQLESADVGAVVRAHDSLCLELAQLTRDAWLDVFHRNCGDGHGWRFDAMEIARRRLRGLALRWLTASGHAEDRVLALRQYQAADNMTDALAALVALNDWDCPERSEALAHFRQRWRAQPLVLDKWLALQAGARLTDRVEAVTALLQAPEFDLRNPNRVRALLGTFAQHNLRGFHQADGAGYRLVADQIAVLDTLNPQVAARLASAFTRWRRFAEPYRGLMRGQLERLHDTPGLSADVAEIVSKSLG
ncbi:MAG TPA: aminopeptidase N [Nevskiales bacterium]|nr:aminopeptidase N [Nevskiales bacterium]